MMGPNVSRYMSKLSDSKRFRMLDISYELRLILDFNLKKLNIGIELIRTALKCFMFKLLSS